MWGIATAAASLTIMLLCRATDALVWGIATAAASITIMLLCRATDALLWGNRFVRVLVNDLLLSVLTKDSGVWDIHISHQPTQMM